MDHFSPGGAHDSDELAGHGLVGIDDAGVDVVGAAACCLIGPKLFGRWRNTASDSSCHRASCFGCGVACEVLLCSGRVRGDLLRVRGNAALPAADVDSWQRSRVAAGASRICKLLANWQWGIDRRSVTKANRVNEIAG